MLSRLLSITNQLLDLGKRNRLLNFKDVGLKTLVLLNKNIEVIFRGIKNAKEFPIFNVDSVLSDYQKQSSEDINYTYEQVYEICYPFLDKEVLGYKKSYSLEKTLKSLIKDYKFSLSEKGINSLYLSFGFVHYQEEQEDYVAPLLLIPIELNYENDFYTIKEYEDEILLNPTLKFYFKSNFNVELLEYKDEALSTYFTKIRELLPAETALENGMAIGIYSFYKMNMYNDLLQNQQIVIKNNNIRALLGEYIPVKEKKINEPIYPVVNCDSSQLEAIQFAANGKSFCLQGPPGSGKSQTITNIISSLLGSGKKILFVSEKIAALNVVYENLKRVRLSDFAIELHSNKSNKKEFIDSLYQSATAPRYDVDFKSRFVEARYNELKSNLDAYEKEIHTILPELNISLVDLYSMYLNISADPMNYELEVEEDNLFDLDRVISLLKKYITYSHTIGYDYRNSALYGLNRVSENYILYDLNRDLDTTIKYLEFLLQVQVVLNDNTDLQLICLEDCIEGFNLVEKIVKLKTFAPSYFDKKVRARLINLIHSYISMTQSMNDAVIKNYQMEVLNEDLDKMYAVLTKGNSGIFKGKEFKSFVNTLLSYRHSKIKTDALTLELQQLIQYKKRWNLWKDTERTIATLLKTEEKLNYKQIFVDLKSLNDCPSINLTYKGYEAIGLQLKDKISKIDKKECMRALSGLSILFDQQNFDLYRRPVSEVFERCVAIGKERKKFITYMKLLDCLEKLEENKAIDYLNTFLSLYRNLDTLVVDYKKLFIRYKIKRILDASPLLQEFTSLSEEEVVDTFRQLDEKKLNINRDYIVSKNSQKRPEAEIVEGSEFKILAHEHEKLRKQLPIRSLLEQIFELALDIKPVFLMSPLSVSTYLTAKMNMFDCVIFDEASQIFASDALGAIYRAKQCIIIGDTKQMPPTNFFHAGIDDEDTKMYDLESILDKAMSIFDTTSLKWHYRSRSEELITFSNQSFYNNNLITIPQAKEHEQGFGIDFYYVEDGRYDPNTRTNLLEAKKVCDMVFEHYASSKESLGVVAFSNVQAELISGLIEKRLKKHPEEKSFFESSEIEPFFVKNLESVQGDERDRIIFSICYGYNSENKFYQRFGPLNNLGGERRLNVAITRAKYNISVVSSILPSDIKDKTEAKGVLLLKSYLEFAQNVQTLKKFEESKNGVINSVKEYIEEIGYEAYPHFGTSSFKIDLAVKKDDEFVMAIMFDGEGKYTSNVTDKYRLEKLVLERLGWKYYRLYSTAWIRDMHEEKKHLLEALRKEREESADFEHQEVSYLKVDKSLDSLDSCFNIYEELSIDRAKDYLKYKGFEYVLREFIRIEEPIHESFLLKKLYAVFDKTKSNTVLKSMVEKSLPIDVYKIEDFYCLNRPEHLTLRIGTQREIGQVHREELIDGILMIVSKHNGIKIEGCYKTMAQLLGYDKIMPNIRKCFDEVLEFLVLSKKLRKKENALFKK